MVDNICGDWDFEDGGNPVVMNRVMAAVDPVLTDAWVCHLMGYAVEEVPYITMAQELGAGCADWKKAKVRELNRPEEEAVVPKTEKLWNFRMQWKKWNPAAPVMDNSYRRWIV